MPGTGLPSTALGLPLLVVGTQFLAVTGLSSEDSFRNLVCGRSPSSDEGTIHNSGLARHQVKEPLGVTVPRVHLGCF